MAKAKKPEASEGGATKKQATQTKKAATPPAEESAAQKTTKAAASSTRAAASTTKAAAPDDKAAVGGATKKKAQARHAAGASAATPSVPLIDTSLAAATAAQFVMNRALLGGAAPTGSTAPSGAPSSPQEGQPEGTGDDKRESSTFRQLKAGLNKPAVGGLGGILGNTSLGKKGTTPFGGGNQQTGRNQTFGADVNRAGVPRRTGG